MVQGPMAGTYLPAGTAQGRGSACRKKGRRTDVTFIDPYAIDLESDTRPWPLATRAKYRLMAWPRFDDPAELDFMFGTFGAPFVGRDDVCLCIRVDPLVDGCGSDVLPLLLEAFARTIGADAELDILLVDDPLTEEDWPLVGQAIHGVIGLGSSSEPRRAEFLSKLGKARVGNSAEAATCIPERSATGLDQSVMSDEALAKRIQELHPWYYPLRIRRQTVTPGVGATLSAEELTGRAHCRTSLLVDQVAERVDLVNRSLLDLGSNCGFWAAHYVARGVSRVVGIEGRERSRDQAELYWSIHEALPADSRLFIQGDVADARSWLMLRDHGPYDLTLMAGILHHVPNYREVITWASKLTREVMIIDTRVTHGEEKELVEPEDRHFNSIDSRRRRVVPNLARLLTCLKDLGTNPELLQAEFEAGPGVEGADDYGRGNRVVILARRG
jgi:SAM-dependent methyltransferase